MDENETTTVPCATCGNTPCTCDHSAEMPAEEAAPATDMPAEEPTQ